jgi:hypothetical protein
MSGNGSAGPSGHPLKAAAAAAGIAVLLTFVWLEVAEGPLVGPVMYAGGIILLLSPMMWLGFFLMALPCSIVFFRPEGRRLANGGLAIFALLPLGCLFLIPGVTIVAHHHQEQKQDEARERQIQSDAAVVREAFEHHGDLGHFKNRSDATEQALGGIFGIADGPQLHTLTSAYLDDPQLMAWMANASNIEPEDLRSIFDHYDHDKDLPHLQYPVIEKLAANSRTPPDVLLKLATPRYRYLSLKNPSLPSRERLKIFQILLKGDVRARCLVAGNRYAPPEMLEKLASDSEVLVRLSVAENLSTPTSVLEVLAKDKNEVGVRNRAKWTLESDRGPITTQAQ